MIKPTDRWKIIITYIGNILSNIFILLAKQVNINMMEHISQLSANAAKEEGFAI